MAHGVPHLISCWSLADCPALPMSEPGSRGKVVNTAFFGRVNFTFPRKSPANNVSYKF